MTDQNVGEYESFVPISNRNFSNDLPNKLRTNLSSTSKLIYYLQTGVLDKTNKQPYHISIKFKAPFVTDPNDFEKQVIKYDTYGEANELALLENREFEQYCQIQCLKIGHYMQQVRQTEILQMNAEFIRDDCDNIWWTYANKIQYRKVERKKTQEEDAEDDAQTVAF